MSNPTTIEKILFKFQNESFKFFNQLDHGAIDKETCIQRMVECRNEALSTIEQLVLEKVIGQTIEPIDVGALTGPTIRRKNSKAIYMPSNRLTEAQGAYLITHNNLIIRQRQALTQLLRGDKQ